MIAAGLIVLASLAVYANSLTAPFVFDDVPAIVDNPSIRQLTALARVFSPPAQAGSAAGRPLVNLSFALNYSAGRLDPRGYHAANLLIHLLASLTLFGVVRRTLLQPKLLNRYGSAALPLATAITVLWSVHPLLTESVICVVQRTELLGGLFYLLTFYCAIRAISETNSPHWSISAGVACFAGVASKETVATVPLLVLLYDRWFVAGTFREAWRRRRWLYVALFSSWALLAWLMAGSHHRGGTVGFDLGLSAWEYLLTQCRAVVLYLQLSFWPHPLILDYGTDVDRSVLTILPQAGLLGLLAALTLVAFWRRWFAGFAGAWFFVILAPSSSVVPLTSQTMAEHRMYLPLAAVVSLAVLGAHARLGRRSVWLGLGAAVALGVGTVRRNTDYRSAISLWGDNATKRPGNSRAHTHFAHALEIVGRFDDALAEFREAARLAPGYSPTHYNLGFALLKTGRTIEAEAAFREALRLRPDYAEAHSNLSVALSKQQRVPEAIAELETALRLQPAYAEAHYNLANLLAQTGRAEEALAHYQAAQSGLPGDANLPFNWGCALLELHRFKEAATKFEAVLQLNRSDTEAARNLALARQATPPPTTNKIEHHHE